MIDDTNSYPNSYLSSILGASGFTALPWQWFKTSLPVKSHGDSRIYISQWKSLPVLHPAFVSRVVYCKVLLGCASKLGVLEIYPLILHRKLCVGVPSLTHTHLPPWHHHCPSTAEVRAVFVSMPGLQGCCAVGCYDASTQQWLAYREWGAARKGSQERARIKRSGKQQKHQESWLFERSILNFAVKRITYLYSHRFVRRH